MHCPSDPTDLIGSKRMAELLAHSGVLHCKTQAGLRSTQGAGGNVDTAAVKTFRENASADKKEEREERKKEREKEKERKRETAYKEIRFIT